MALTTQQITGLNAAAARQAAGTANATDLANLKYAAGQGYKAPSAAPAAAPKVQTGAPSPSPTIPKGAVPIPNPAAIKDYNVVAQVGATGTPGSTLYGIPKTPAATTPTSPTATPGINSQEDANAHINANQATDFSTAASSSDPATRSSVQSYQDIYDSITKSLTSNLPTKPDTVSLKDTYNTLRTQYGVGDLESSLTSLQAQARDLQAASAARTQAELDKPVAMNVISGRITEEERQDNQRLQAINNSIQTVTSQLQSKYNVIDSLMKYTGQDYTNAVNAYDTQFSRNVQVMNTVKGMVDTQQTHTEQQADDARANLQIIYNNLNSGGVDPKTIDPAQKANITKLELQAGLPQGFYENVVNKNPKADILSTTTREVGGKKYADILTRNADGSLKVTTQYIGAVSSGSGGAKKPTAAEVLQSKVSAMAKDLNTMKGSDGYISPTDYKQGKQLWVEGGGDSATYDKTFGTAYVNPTDYKQAGLALDATRYNTVPVDYSADYNQ